MRANHPFPAVAAGLALALLAVAPAATAIDLTASIVNVPPVIVSITLSGLTAGALSPTAGATSSLTATVVASDNNGAADITGITVGIVKPDGSTVHLSETSATQSSNSGLLATYTKTLAMDYFDAPAVSGSTYKVSATVLDAAGLDGIAALTLATFSYNELVALNAPATLTLSANPGGSSAATALTVSNYGNMQIDTQLSGTDLTLNAVSLDVTDIDYSLASNMAAATDLTESSATLATFNLGAANGASKALYFQLTPTTPASGLPAGDYVGTLTVTAVSG